MTTELGQRVEPLPATRIDLVRKLLGRLDRLATRLGEVSVAAEIQLLKRELVRSHKLLSTRPEDNNFLSIVSLVEAALTALTWKDYSPVVLDAMRRAFTAGLKDAAVSFEEYDAIRRHFKTAGITTGPTIDVDVPELSDEGEDGSQT